MGRSRRQPSRDEYAPEVESEEEAVPPPRTRQTQRRMLPSKRKRGATALRHSSSNPRSLDLHKGVCPPRRSTSERGRGQEHASDNDLEGPPDDAEPIGPLVLSPAQRKVDSSNPSRRSRKAMSSRSSPSHVLSTPHRACSRTNVASSGVTRCSGRGLESMVKKGIAAIFGVCRSTDQDIQVTLRKLHDIEEMYKKIYAKNLSPQLSPVRPYEPSFSPPMYADNPWDYYDIMMATSGAPKDDDVDEDPGGIRSLLKKGFIAIFGVCRSMHQDLQYNIRKLHDLEEMHKKIYAKKNLSPQLSPLRPYEPSFSPSMYPDNPWDYYNDIMMATSGAPKDDDVDEDHGGIRSLFKKAFIAIVGVHRSIHQDLEYMHRKHHDLREMQKKIFTATNLSAPLFPVRPHEPLFSASVFTENPWDYYNDIMVLVVPLRMRMRMRMRMIMTCFGSDVGAADNSRTFLMNVVMMKRLLQHPLFI